MTGENGQAKLEPIAMHKPPQEIFARYRELGPGVVGYISMGTGLTGRKIITPTTSAGDRLTTIDESLRDDPTPMGGCGRTPPRVGGGATPGGSGSLPPKELKKLRQCATSRHSYV